MTPSPPPLLEIDGLTVQLPVGGTARPVLRDVSFTAYPGEVTALVGDNGAGKSTLVTGIGGIYPFDAGEYFFDGNQVSRWRTWEAATPGMYLEVDFGTPTMASGVSLATHWPLAQAEIFGKTTDSRWTLLSNKVTAEPRPRENLRRETIRSLKRAGVQRLDYFCTASGNPVHTGDRCTGEEHIGVRLTVGGRGGTDIDAFGARIDEEQTDDAVIVGGGNQHGVGDLGRGHQLLGSVEAPAVAITACDGRGSGRPGAPRLGQTRRE